MGGDGTDRRAIMNMKAVVGRIVQTMQAREGEGKAFGVIVMSEGLAAYLPEAFIKEVARDPFDNIALSQIFAKQVAPNFGVEPVSNAEPSVSAWATSRGVPNRMLRNLPAYVHV